MANKLGSKLLTSSESAEVTDLVKHYTSGAKKNRIPRNSQMIRPYKQNAELE